MSCLMVTLSLKYIPKSRKPLCAWYCLCTWKTLQTSLNQNLMRKCNAHFALSEVAGTLKVGQGHQNWYESVKLSEDSIMWRLKGLFKTVSERKPRSGFLPWQTGLPICQLHPLTLTFTKSILHMTLSIPVAIKSLNLISSEQENAISVWQKSLKIHSCQACFLLLFFLVT